jgi:hypothetical protein
MKSQVSEIRLQAKRLRESLEPAFTRATALPGWKVTSPSSGQCAAVAALVKRHLGGWLVSAIVSNESHWFNRLRTGNKVLDVDLTGDQFGRSAIQVAPRGTLYQGTKRRNWSDLDAETLARSRLLEQRAGLEGSTRKRKIFLGA